MRHPIVDHVVANAAEWAVMLLPLAVYLMLMGLLVSSRRRPVVMSGQLNLFLLFLGLSGFLLVGPATWLVHPFRLWGVSEYWRAYLAYTVMISLFALGAILRQRRTLVIFSIDPTVLGQVLEAILDRMRIEYAATPGRLALNTGQVIDLEPSFIWNTVTLRWRSGPGDLGREIEQHLVAELRNVTTRRHPSGIILMMLALFLLVFVSLAALLWSIW